MSRSYHVRKGTLVFMIICIAFEASKFWAHLSPKNLTPFDITLTIDLYTATKE